MSLDSRYSVGPHALSGHHVVGLHAVLPVVPNRAAVYGIAVPERDWCVECLGPQTQCIVEHKGERYRHLYTGETYAARNRLLEHIEGDVSLSTFRHSMLALCSIGLGPLPAKNADEVQLSRWLGECALVGWLEAEFIGEVEAELISVASGTVNLRGRQACAWTRKIRMARREHPVASFHRHPSDALRTASQRES